MRNYDRVHADVSLGAISENMDRISKIIGKNTKVMGIIKADGYGHGAIPIAKSLAKKDYLWGFAVATGNEALEIRRELSDNPILVLGAVFPEQIKDLIENDIRLCLYSAECTAMITEAAAKLGKKAKVHLKIDTGMGRIGFFAGKEHANELIKAIDSPHIFIEGIFTHFAKADEIDKSYANKQYEAFIETIDALEAAGIHIPNRHCANSAGIIDGIGADFEIVRAGIAMYGLYPSEEVIKENVELKPAMSLYSSVIFTKTIPAGTPISYGGTFVSEASMRVATIPVGYADGYPRSLSNKGYVLIHGKKARVLGRVCMDQMMVDVTDIEDVLPGDRVTLIGTDGSETIKVEDLSDLSGRFNYEFVCDISKRVPRYYV